MNTLSFHNLTSNHNKASMNWKFADLLPEPDSHFDEPFVAEICWWSSDAKISCKV